MLVLRNTGETGKDGGTAEAMIGEGQTDIDLASFAESKEDSSLLPSRITFVIPVYNNLLALRLNLEVFREYEKGTWEAVIVDDCSENDQNVNRAIVEFEEETGHVFGDELRVIRIREDVPWNMPQGYNLGLLFARTRFVMMKDVDHIVSPEMMRKFAAEVAAGRVDDNEIVSPQRLVLEDARLRSLSHEVALKPAPNIFVATKWTVMSRGGYDEDFAGCYGCDIEFRNRMRRSGVRFRHFEDLAVHVCYYNTGRYNRSVFVRDTNKAKELDSQKKESASFPSRALRVVWEIVKR